MDSETSKSQEYRAARLVAARKAAGHKSAREAALIHRWPESTYRAHEAGTRNFKWEEAQKYAEAFGVPVMELWLSSCNGKNVTPRKYLLPNMTGTRHSVDSSRRRIKVMGRAAGSPEGELLMGSEAVDMVACPASLDDVPDAYAVYVVGESMDPRYCAGELVFVHPTKPYRRGDYVVVQVSTDGSPEPHGFIKKFVTLTPSTLVLQQLNPPREMEFDRSKVLTIHKIVLSGEG